MTKESINKALEAFRIPHFYRDIMVAVVGIGFLLATSLHFYPDYQDFIAKFARKGFSIETDILFIVSGYIVGRFLLILSNILLLIYNVLSIFIIKLFLVRPVASILPEYKRKIVAALRNYINVRTTTVGEMLRKTTIADMAEIEERLPSIRDLIERENLNAIFLGATTSTLFLACFFISWKFVFPFLLFFMLLVNSKYYLTLHKVSVWEAAVKESSEKNH